MNMFLPSGVLTKKLALHPNIGTKGKPSAVPPAIRLTAQLLAQQRLRSLTESTRHTLLLVQAAAHGGRPAVVV